MTVHGQAAPPTPWSRDLAEPTLHKTAYVHSFSNLIGDVYVGAGVLIAPGTSIRADEGAPFHIGDHTNIQDGVVIHGLEQGRVIGDDQRSYSVWIGRNSCITHMALVHGPAYVGDDCFIGFRSTVFNARIGRGCIVMMHALIQDVEIPAGKYVPSGAVITNQQQADRLPDVQEVDRQFAYHVVQVNEALRAGYRCAEDETCITPIREGLHQSANGNGAISSSRMPVGGIDLNSAVVEQVRSLLRQGYRIGTEHADSRRFKRNSWLSCAPIQSQRESEVLADLDACLAEHQGEYVRLIGIDPAAKRRVLETLIQQPDGQPPKAQSRKTVTGNAARSYSRGSSHKSKGTSSTDLDSEVEDLVRSLLRQGYRVGTEHADPRRFKRNSWKTCAPIHSERESEVFPALETCLAEHAGEYVRLIGIDPKAKRRVLEQLIQRPDDQPPQVQSHKSTAGRGFNTSSNGSGRSRKSTGGGSTGLDPEVGDLVRSLLRQGCRIGAEHADPRRFKRNSWLSCPPIQSQRESEVLAGLETCLAEHQGEYVRLIGIDSTAKRRVLEQLIQRPDSQASQARSAASTSERSSGNRQGRASQSVNRSANLSAEIVAQVRSLLNQGYRIGLEHANQRRFKTSSWQSCGSIQGQRESEVLAELEAALADYEDEYIRLIGIDSKAKRRVLESIIHRPKSRV